MFLDISFPGGLSYGIRGGPVFDTTIGSAVNGFEVRNQNWQIPKHQFFLDLVGKTPAEIEQLKSFFYIIKGALHSFRFRDPFDNVANNSLLAIADGSVSVFKLTKQYHFDQHIYVRENILPIAESINVRVDGAAVDFKFDSSTGSIILDKVPKASGAITADFDFDIEARFDNDYLPCQYQGHNDLSVSELKIVEVK